MTLKQKFVQFVAQAKKKGKQLANKALDKIFFSFQGESQPKEIKEWYKKLRQIEIENQMRRRK